MIIEHGFRTSDGGAGGGKGQGKGCSTSKKGADFSRRNAVMSWCSQETLP
nr:hypothetical protein [uncultured Ottowia sp.]